MSSRAYRLYGSGIDWSDPDLSVLDTSRGPVPAIPMALLPQPWRDWIADTERATGAPADYAVQSVLAAVAAMCGAGVSVRVTPAWDEPLVLWLALVGEPSTGKSTALAPMRRLLDAVEQERRLGDEERRAAHAERIETGVESGAFVPSQVVADDADPTSLAGIVAGNPRGVLSWRDRPREDGDAQLAMWLAAWEARAVTVVRARQPAHTIRHLPISIIETSRPGPLRESLQAGDHSLAARFLFAWPGPQPYRALTVVERSHEQAILQRLDALSRLARSPDDPCVIEVDARGRAALDGVLGPLHAERGKAEGPEATWLGVSRSLIVRLAGALHLLGSIDGRVVRPGAIGAEQVEAAAALWRDYYWPHAKAVFDGAELSDHKKRVRRVARWLLEKRPATVSRDEIRRRALSLSATGDEVEHVLQRLHYLGYVQPDIARRDAPGRPTTHWLVNPAIVEGEKPTSKLSKLS